MNNKTTILVVDDDKTTASFLSTVLTSNDYRVLTISTGREALTVVSSHCPDVMLLDLGLPDMDGMEVLKAVREWSSIPIIIVSARNSDKDKANALDSGADDYITKPFGTLELLARIRCAIRHNRKTTLGSNENSSVYNIGDLSIDYDKRIVTVCGEDVHLTQIEYKIITLLAKYSGRVLTYDFIINEIWGPFGSKDNQILRVNMANIRRKIEKNPAEPKYILTEVGVGYRMVEEIANEKKNGAF